MRFLFKTSYEQDVRLIQHSGQLFWNGLLIVALLVSPIILPEFWLAQLNLILVYSMVGLGMMILLGYTGQLSLGHAAFLAWAPLFRLILSIVAGHFLERCRSPSSPM